MKLMFNVADHSVCRVPEDDFSKIPGVTNNGQHWQLAGHIIAEVSIPGGNKSSRINLFHYATDTFSNHVDVMVVYNPDFAVPLFHQHACEGTFVPSAFGSDIQNLIWPTGGWSLLQAVFALESFLVADVGFRPMLREALFDTLQRSTIPVPA